MAAVDVAVLNRMLKRGRHRAEELEPRLASLLEPILNRAGDDAARRFPTYATNVLTAANFPTSGTFRAPSPASTMVAVKPRPEEAAALAEEGGEPAETLHVTLALLGDTSEEDVPAVVEALQSVAAMHAPLAGEVGGVGVFDDNGNGHPAILLPDVRGLVELRQAVCTALVAAGIDYARGHGFQPHLTIRYGDGEPASEDSIGLPLHFDDLVVARGDIPYPLPLVGAPAVTAAGEKPPPDWIAPGPDELVDVDALVAALTERSRAVRLAFLERVARETVEAAGISWDLTNPFIARALAETGSQITHIGETTRLNVMKIIAKSYEEGLSIRDTAAAIRAGMRAATPGRATLIARTEMAGAVNSGSLAAVQIVDAATGQGHYKTWLTAAFAKHPRHALYDGLNGQTRRLNAYFTVGSAQLQYPGDFNGPPGEVCNCVAEGTIVQLPDLRYATKRWYEGNLVRVRFARGDEFAVTPNHPILRADGCWIAAGSLVEGDYCIGGRLVGHLMSEPDEDRMPAEVSEIYRSAEVVGEAERVGARPDWFHGDGLDRDVDVVSVDRELRVDRQPASDEQVAKLGLALAERARSGSSYRLNAAGEPTGSPAGDFPAASSSVGRFGEPASLRRLSRGHPHAHGRASIALLDAEFSETTRDDASADFETLGESENALSVQVALGEIVQIERDSAWAGWVFNFDTGHGFYLIGNGGVICGNCRCALAYSENPRGALAE